MCQKQILVDCGTDKNFCDDCQQRIDIETFHIDEQANELMLKFFNMPKNFNPQYAPEIDHIDFPI